MAVQTRGKNVHAANLGLYLDRPPLLVPERGLSAGQNFRIYNGEVTNRNVGYSAFPDSGGQLNLDGKPVLLCEEFQPLGGVRTLVLGNTTDLFSWTNGGALAYLTPRHDSTGETIAVTNGDATVEGTSTAWQTDGIKAGDFLVVGADETDPTATWYEIASVTDENTLELTETYNEANDTGLAYTIRKTFTGDLFTPFLTEVFRNGVNHSSGADGDRWYATNGVDPVVAWDGAADQVYYVDLGTMQTCNAIRRFKNTLVYLAPTDSGTKLGQDVITSAIGQPENIATLEAAQFTIHDGGAELIAAHQIGELLAIHAKDQAVIMTQFVGQPFHFVFRAAIVGKAARSARGIIRFPSSHIFFGSDGQYTFDGVAARQSATQVWKEITRTSSPNRSKLVQGIIDEGNAELVWIVPLNSDADTDTGPPERAFVGHYLEDVGDYPMAHSRRQIPATAVGQFVLQDTLTFDEISEQFDELSIRWDDQQLQEAFPQIIFGDNNGLIWQLNTQLQAGVVPTSFVRFSRRPLVDSRRNGVVKRVYTNGDFQDMSEEQMTVKIRLFDSPNSVDPRSTAEQNILLDGTGRFAAFRNSGRFIEVELGSGPTVPGIWSVEGYDLDVVPGGER